MNVVSFIAVCGVCLSAVCAQSITLDIGEMETIKQQVFGGAVVPPRADVPKVEDQSAQRWVQVMEAAGTDMMPVLLLAMLQELNVASPLAAHPREYASALELHRLAAAGNAQACATLAQALRSGMLPSGLLLFRNEGLAVWLEERSSSPRRK